MEYNHRSRLRIGLGDFATQIGYDLRRGGRLFQPLAPERLLLAPQELRASDPTTATDIYSGHFILAGRMVLTRGESPYRVASPSPAWTRELFGFDWLRHFRDTDNAVIREHGRALVAEWLEARDVQRSPMATAPVVVARRVLSWLINSPLLLAGADHDFYRKLLRALARDASLLELAAAKRGSGVARLTAAIAFANYTLCALTADNDWKKSSRLLAAALSESILPDGCHVSRNPRDVIEAALDLLPLRNAYAARGRTPPAELQNAIDRIMPFVRMMRHPDGQMALFNGMGNTPLDLVGALMAFDDTKGLPAMQAPYGGYHRLERNQATLFVDCAGAPPLHFSNEAHAGALAFEFSAGYERIFVNCGSAPAGLDSIREALRETAAHSTFAVDGAPSARFRPGRASDGGERRRLSDFGRRPDCSRESGAAGETLSLRHTGYSRSFGIVHERSLTLASDGRALHGVDRIASDGGRKSPEFPQSHLRFHLHPRIMPEPSASMTSVRLHLADGTAWLFDCGGHPLAIEESIFFGGLEGQRQTFQIAIPVAAAGTELRWKLVQG